MPVYIESMKVSVYSDATESTDGSFGPAPPQPPRGNKNKNLNQLSNSNPNGNNSNNPNPNNPLDLIPEDNADSN